MKDKMMKLLFELLKNSKRSDREIAKVLGVSQPTITRMRNKLVKEGLIREFTVIPDFAKMGYEILAISSFRSKRTKETTQRAIEWTNAKPNVIFAAAAQGMGKNAVIVSLHKNYTDYSNFIEEIMAEAASLGVNILESYDSLLISLAGRIVKPLSLAYLAEQKET